MNTSSLVAHIDMNSYFASVEQQANASLRGKPLGVCAYLSEHSCIIAASIEAKALGIKVGMTVKEARKQAPEARFVECDPPKYRAVTKKLFALMNEYASFVEPYSIDEAFLDATGGYEHELLFLDALLGFRGRVQREIGSWLKLSFGIAPNKLLAKMGSDFQKPNGSVWIPKESISNFLTSRALQDVPGIGRAVERRLKAQGWHTLTDFVHAPEGHVLRVGGKPLRLLQRELQGECRSRIQDGRAPPKSIGHSYCVPKRVNEDGLVVAVWLKLLEKAAFRLREEGMRAGALVGYVSTEPADPAQSFFSRFAEQRSRVIRFSEPTNDAWIFLENGLDLLSALWNGQERVTFLALTFTDLTSVTPQLRLPTMGARESRSASLTEALQRIHAKHGLAALRYGVQARLQEEAPDRIGFRKL